MDREAPEQPTVSRKNPASPGRRLTAQRLSKTPAREPDGTAAGGPKRAARQAPRTRREKSSRAKAEVKGTARRTG